MSLPQLEPEVKSIPLMPIEIQDLELATGYEMFGRCQVDKEEDLWGEWSPILPFQTPPSGEDLWASHLFLSWKSGHHAIPICLFFFHPHQLQKMCGSWGTSAGHQVDRNPCFCGR